MNDRHGKREQAIAACPVVDRPAFRAYMAVMDAQDLVLAVRDLDPREVWGTFAVWVETDPLRLFAAATALAAMVPADRPARELLAWTERLSPASEGRFS